MMAVCQVAAVSRTMEEKFTTSSRGRGKSQLCYGSNSNVRERLVVIKPVCVCNKCYFPKKKKKKKKKSPNTVNANKRKSKGEQTEAREEQIQKSTMNQP